MQGPNVPECGNRNTGTRPVEHRCQVVTHRTVRLIKTLLWRLHLVESLDPELVHVHAALVLGLGLAHAARVLQILWNINMVVITTIIVYIIM